MANTQPIYHFIPSNNLSECGCSNSVCDPNDTRDEQEYKPYKVCHYYKNYMYKSKTYSGDKVVIGENGIIKIDTSNTECCET